MTTHISIYKGYASQVESATTAPTDREMTEYKTGSGGSVLEDGDWYYNSSNNALGIHIGGSWYYIEFTSTT